VARSPDLATRLWIGDRIDPDEVVIAPTWMDLLRTALTLEPAHPVASLCYPEPSFHIEHLGAARWLLEQTRPDTLAMIVIKSLSCKIIFGDVCRLPN